MVGVPGTRFIELMGMKEGAGTLHLVLNDLGKLKKLSVMEKFISQLVI